MQDNRPEAMRRVAAMPVAEQHSYMAAWLRVEIMIEGATKKTDKVFEVHHRITHAREKFYAAIVAGKTPDECEVAAK